MADTFAKFGLNMDSLAASQKDNQESLEIETQLKKISCKVEALLEMVPDFGFLTDSKLYMD